MPRSLWAELALDDDQRDSFPGELDGMGMPELVAREAPPDASSGHFRSSPIDLSFLRAQAQ